MPDNEFRDALLRGQGDIDAHAIADRVGRRDRRWIRSLAALCIFAWMMVVMAPWAVALPELGRLERARSEPATLHYGDQTWQSIQTEHAVMITFISSLAFMAMAAICTVALILLSRRATLRQINARLAELSAQLKSLDKPKTS